MRQTEERTADRRSAKVAVQCSADTFVVNQSSVLRINICSSKSPTSFSCKRSGGTVIVLTQELRQN